MRRRELSIMATITSAPPARWYWPAMTLLAVGLAVATALAIYFAVTRTSEVVPPQHVQITDPRVGPGPNCTRPLVPC
jgi:hypothetical protein